jgi:hypothetical protein
MMILSKMLIGELLWGLNFLLRTLQKYIYK